MEVASRKSDKARLKMKMFLAVLISFLLSTADITSKFPKTEITGFSVQIPLWGDLSDPNGGGGRWHIGVPRGLMGGTPNF